VNTKPIKWRLHIPVAPAIVFRALDTNDGRARFWAQSAVERDGVIQFEFINGQTWEAAIVERIEPSGLAIDYFGGTARFELADDGAGGTDLTLTHTEVSEDDWNETHAGWLNVLLTLKAWLVTGVDIRNHDPKRTWDQGYVDQ
jgi:Activator of Hsp90 ATPase homolog 1-like protein